MSNVNFEDYSISCKAAIKDESRKFLQEACSMMKSQVQRNTRVDTGQTKGSWHYRTDGDKLIGYIGSDYENAIWEEFGTGLYAVNGDGRKKVPWWYKDEKGVWHQTSGKKPSRALFNAFQSLRDTLIKTAQARLGAIK